MYLDSLYFETTLIPLTLIIHEVMYAFLEFHISLYDSSILYINYSHRINTKLDINIDMEKSYLKNI